MALTRAQMIAIVNSGGSVVWPPIGGTALTTVAALPTDAQILSYFSGLAAGQTLVIQPNLVLPGVIAANGDIVAVLTSGYGHFSLDIQGTFNGTLVTEYSTDGATWRAMNLFPLSDLTNAPGISSIVNNGAFNNVYDGGLTNVQQIRVRASAWTSGSANIVLNLTPYAPIVKSRAAIPAGENHLGAVGGNTAVPNATFTRPNDANAYAAGDTVNNSTSAPAALAFAGCARLNAGTGIIVGATLVDETNQATKGSYELWVFAGTAAPTMQNDNAAFAPANADIVNLVAVIPFAVSYIGNTSATTTGNVVFPATGLNVPFKCGAAVTSLWGILVVRNAYTPIANEVFVAGLQIAQD